MAGKPGWACPVELYVLTTTSLARKYIGVLRSVRGKKKKKSGGKAEGGPRRMFVSDSWRWAEGDGAGAQESDAVVSVGVGGGREVYGC